MGFDAEHQPPQRAPSGLKRLKGRLTEDDPERCADRRLDAHDHLGLPGVRAGDDVGGDRLAHEPVHRRFRRACHDGPAFRSAAEKA